MGGGSVLAADLVNWLGHLNRNKSDEDDDTLYVYKDKEQMKSASVGTGLAIAGGVGSALASGLIVHNIYNKIRKAEAQKELDEAQKAFVEVQGYKPVKKDKKKDKKKDDDKQLEKKSKAVSLGETIASAPIALPLLVALGTGVASYGLLNNAYPIRKKKVKGPRKIEIVEKPSDDQAEYAGGLDKPASYCDDDARELVVRMLCANDRGVSDIRNLVGAVADGDSLSFKKTASDIGFVNALDTVKGGEHRTDDKLAKHLAVSYISKEASIKTQVGVVAAAEFATKYPTFYKVACGLPKGKKDALFKIACIIGKAVRADISTELGVTPPSGLDKSASYEDEYDPAEETVAAKLIGELLGGVKKNK